MEGISNKKNNPHWAVKMLINRQNLGAANISIHYICANEANFPCHHRTDFSILAGLAAFAGFLVEKPFGS